MYGQRMGVGPYKNENKSENEKEQKMLGLASCQLCTAAVDPFPRVSLLNAAGQSASRPIDAGSTAASCCRLLAHGARQATGGLQARGITTNGMSRLATAGCTGFFRIG
jgi:hypothetical protein